MLCHTNGCLSRTHSTSPPTSNPSESTSSILRSEEHTSELQSPCNLVCRLLLEKKNAVARRRCDPAHDRGRHPDRPGGLVRHGHLGPVSHHPWLSRTDVAKDASLATGFLPSMPQ